MQDAGSLGEESAGLVSSLLYTYCNGLLALGSRKVLMQDDLWAVSRCALVVTCHAPRVCL